MPVRVIGTIEARLGSSRLPGKTLAPVFDGMHLLECVVRRFRLAKSVENVVVATTTEPGDDRIAEWCEAAGVAVHRGSEDDVLDRVVGAALAQKADAIVQMGADSAYLDFQMVDHLVGLYNQGGHDYVCNDLSLTYPLGIYGHVVNVRKLADLNDRSDLTVEDREDVVRFIWEHPETYRILSLQAPPELACPELRLTVDYPEDMEQAQCIYRHFGNCEFTTSDLIGLYRATPEVFAATLGLEQHSAPFIQGHSSK